MDTKTIGESLKKWGKTIAYAIILIGVAMVVAAFFSGGNAKSTRNARLLELGPILAQKNVELATAKEAAISWNEKYHSLRTDIDALVAEQVELMNQNVDYKEPLPSLTPTTSPLAQE